MTRPAAAGPGWRGHARCFQPVLKLRLASSSMLVSLTTGRPGRNLSLASVWVSYHGAVAGAGLWLTAVLRWLLLTGQQTVIRR